MAEEKKNYRNYSPNANYGAAVFGSEAYEPEWILPATEAEIREEKESGGRITKLSKKVKIAILAAVIAAGVIFHFRRKAAKEKLYS